MKPGAGCAERDVLTGLPNTRASAITKRLESGRPFALLLADMEALKVMRGYVRSQQPLRPRAAS